MGLTSERDFAELHGMIPGHDYTQPLRAFERREFDRMTVFGYVPADVKDERLRLAWALLAEDHDRIGSVLQKGPGPEPGMAAMLLRRRIGCMQEHLRRLEDVARACEVLPALPSARRSQPAGTSEVAGSSRVAAEAQSSPT